MLIFIKVPTYQKYFFFLIIEISKNVPIFKFELKSIERIKKININGLITAQQKSNERLTQKFFYGSCHFLILPTYNSLKAN